MTALESIVDVQISRETSSVSQAGFGAAAFLSNAAQFQERVKVYSSLASVNEDTLAGADTVTFAQKYFGQTIRPTQLYVIKKGRDLPRIQTLQVDADLIAANTANVTVDGGTPIAVVFATDHATTLAALATAIQSEAGVVTATVTGPREITITGAADNIAVVLTALSVTGGASQANMTNTVTQYEDGLLDNVASLVAASQINDDWYALAAYERDPADIVLIAAHIQALKKIYGVSSGDSDILTSVTTDIASLLKAASYDRTFILYSNDHANYPEGAWMGGILPNNPGSVTWKFKTLSGVTVSSLTDTERTNSLGKNCNVYTTVGGVNMTCDGKMAEGTFIDIIRGVDWIQARMTENIFSALVNEPKIPFTDDGVSVIVNRIQQILDQAVANTVLTNDPVPEIFAPLVANVSVNDRANRVLPDVTFEGVLAGAIHKVIVRGTVSV